MNYTSIWNIIPLSFQEKVVSLIACNKIVSLNELVEDFYFTDFFETAKEIEKLIEQGHLHPIGKGKFKLNDSKETIAIKFKIRKKLVSIISDLLLEINDNKNNIDYNFNLFSDLDKLWGVWMRDDLNLIYSAVKKNLQNEISKKMRTN